MKRSVALLLFVFALSFSALAQSDSRSGLISKRELASESSRHISKRQLASMIANATAPAEHRQIADYYRAQSRSLMEESIQHAHMRADYAISPAKGVRSMVDHCTYLMRDLKAKSEKAAELASEHEQMAKAGEETRVLSPSK